MRTSELKPHQIDKLLVSLDSEVRKTSLPQNDANFGIRTLADDCKPTSAEGLRHVRFLCPRS